MRKLMFLAMAADSTPTGTGAGIAVGTPAAVTFGGTLQEPAITTAPSGAGQGRALRYLWRE